ncbi:odorant receptor 67c-like [Anabrus simplex]|uniref:odorant receptor 67c-like n=1 Tax=Anabrus simplex TaxID=316456 RepID=UPI0035A29FFB
MLTQFFVASSVLCITAFQLVVFPTGGIRPIGMSAFLASEMLQLGMYCYFGDKIMTESEAVGTSAYSSPWYEGSLELKRSVRIIMTRSQRPSKVTMGKFMPLSLATFASILRGSYTYFTLLNEFND